MEYDPTRMCELLVGLGDVEVLSVGDEGGGPLRVHVRCRAARPGEWREGTSPSRSLRTVRDSLPSYGSRSPAWGWSEEVPVSEELWLALTGSVEPSPGFGGLASQSFELLHRPSDKVFVDARCDVEYNSQAVEDPVVVEPASDPGVDGPGESGKVRCTATVEVPVADLFADRLFRLGAHRW